MNTRNIMLVIEYDGAAYCGWQTQHGKQAHKPSIQETIERVLQRILQQRVSLIAAGRTDAGVHALGQVANFKTTSSFPTRRFVSALNGLLPDDICVRKAQEVDLSFHSRFQATSKIYRYTIYMRRERSALARATSYHMPYPLDLKAMRKEARSLVGTHDFRAFECSGRRSTSAVRTIRSLSLKHQNDFMYIDIRADGFLYNMVRIIAGTLIQAGRKNAGAGGVAAMVRSRDRTQAGPTAPAHGLRLVKVFYPR